MLSQEKIKIKLNRPLRGMGAGTSIQILVDGAGTPLEKYWRDRFADAKHDNCIEIVPKKSIKRDTKTVVSSEEKEA